MAYLFMKLVILEAVETDDLQRSEEFVNWLEYFITMVNAVVVENGVATGHLLGLINTLRTSSYLQQNLFPSEGNWDLTKLLEDMEGMGKMKDSTAPDSIKAESEDDFTHVHGLEEGKNILTQAFYSAIQPFPEQPHKVKDGLAAFIHFQGQSGTYDARCRTTIKNLCSRLEGQHTVFQGAWKQVAAAEGRAASFAPLPAVRSLWLALAPPPPPPPAPGGQGSPGGAAAAAAPASALAGGAQGGGQGPGGAAAPGVLAAAQRAARDPLAVRAGTVALAAAGGGALLYAGGALSTLGPLTYLCSLGSSSTAAVVEYITNVQIAPALWGVIGVSKASARAWRRIADIKDFRFEPLFDYPCDQEGSKGQPIVVLVSGWFSSSISEHCTWGAAEDDGVAEGETHRHDPEDHIDYDRMTNIPGKKQPQSYSSTEEEDEETVAWAELLESSSWEMVRKRDIHPWWKRVASSGEEYILVWEKSLLTSMRRQIENILKEKAVELVRDEVLSATTVSLGIPGAEIPMKLLGLFKMIDDPWSMSTRRAKQAGIMLAEVLMKTFEHGRRPVTLIGFSFGARLIFHCLRKLAKANFLGVVENAVLMGTPVSSKVENWEEASSVVSGRLINVYSRKDWMLATIFRMKSWSPWIAGLAPIISTQAVENFDATSIVGSSHLAYATSLPFLLQEIAILE